MVSKRNSGLHSSSEPQREWFTNIHIMIVSASCLPSRSQCTCKSSKWKKYKLNSEYILLKNIHIIITFLLFYIQGSMMIIIIIMASYGLWAYMALFFQFWLNEIKSMLINQGKLVPTQVNHRFMPLSIMETGTRHHHNSLHLLIGQQVKPFMYKFWLCTKSCHECFQERKSFITQNLPVIITSWRHQWFR